MCRVHVDGVRSGCSTRPGGEGGHAGTSHAPPASGTSRGTAKTCSTQYHKARVRAAQGTLIIYYRLGGGLAGQDWVTALFCSLLINRGAPSPFPLKAYPWLTDRQAPPLPSSVHVTDACLWGNVFDLCLLEWEEAVPVHHTEQSEVYSRLSMYTCSLGFPRARRSAHNT